MSAKKELRIKNRFWPIIVAVLVLLSDQITKILVTTYIKPYETIPLIGSIIQIRLRYNPYGVLSLSFGADYIYYIINIIGVGLIIYFILKASMANFDRLILGAILGGAVGNTIDRLRIGKVTDFIDMGIGNARWPTYNLADAAIFIGIICIIVRELLIKKKGIKEDPAIK